MKSGLWLTVFLMIPMLTFSQVIQDLDFIGPANEGHIPVLKNKKWGFINSQGEVAVNFRSDLIHNEKISSKTDLGVASQQIPSMRDGRITIKKVIDQIPYYGFIDSSGKTVIEPEFLNVSNFNNGYALALKIEEKFLGRNDILDIKIKSYNYDVVLIDREGEVKQYLAGPFPVGISREKLREAPRIEARWVSEDLIAVKNPQNKWGIHKI
ncbi:MAG: WG repeat-containing protein [Bacteroidota bacterium]